MSLGEVLNGVAPFDVTTAFFYARDERIPPWYALAAPSRDKPGPRPKMAALTLFPRLAQLGSPQFLELLDNLPHILRTTPINHQ